MTEYIDRTELKKMYEMWIEADLEEGMEKEAGAVEECLYHLETTPTADVAPVVRCKECKYAYFYPQNGMYECGRLEDRLMFSDDFCSRGEWREDE